MNTISLSPTIVFDKLKDEEKATDTLENQLLGGCYNMLFLFSSASLGMLYGVYRIIS
jgi:hypothetical protein